MFDDILKLVKEHLGGNPQVASAIPADKANAIHNEIASHITTGFANQIIDNGGLAGMTGKLENSIASGGGITSAIEGGLVGSLASKFGLPPAITGAIAGALPGILQKYANRKLLG